MVVSRNLQKCSYRTFSFEHHRPTNGGRNLEINVDTADTKYMDFKMWVLQGLRPRASVAASGAGGSHDDAARIFGRVVRNELNWSPLVTVVLLLYFVGVKGVSLKEVGGVRSYAPGSCEGRSQSYTTDLAT